jgi:hypothetical protein
MGSKSMRRSPSSVTDKSGIVARDQHGMERMVSPTQARSFSVHERQQIEVAPGDRLLLTGNRGECGLPRH